MKYGISESATRVASWIFISLINIGFLSSCASTKPFLSAHQEVVAPVWAEYGPDATFIIRALTTTPHCPVIEANGKPAESMKLRVDPSELFLVRVCEMSYSGKVEGVRVNGVSYSHLTSDPSVVPRKIAVFGDTGCRIKSKDPAQVQACLDAHQWPFKKISDRLAVWNPDLVIHLGDYYYREAPCPDGAAECKNSPYGDAWASWNADFFEPAQNLLKVAPWIMIRGNHELCHRGGKGWFRFLDPYPMSQDCKKFTDPYRVRLGDFDFLVFDTAPGSDSRLIDSDVAEYREEFKKLKSLKIKNGWLLSHRPFWAYDKKKEGLDTKFGISPFLIEASEGLIPSGIHSILSGHIHLFQYLNFKDQGPNQMIMGNGGSRLADYPTELLGDTSQLKIGPRKIKKTEAIQHFGYATFEQIEAKSKRNMKWRVTIHDEEGNVFKECVLDRNQFDCKGDRGNYSNADKKTVSSRFIRSDSNRLFDGGSGNSSTSFTST